jgi:c(7)-type cytochrome triheme protein
MNRFFLFLLAAALLMPGIGYGTGVEQNQKKVSEAEEPIISLEQAAGQLPCFKCHDLKDFLSKEQAGVFSHKKHSGFGVHCNQCHDVGGHTGKPKIRTETCIGCHSLKPLAYEGGGMGKVTFSHNAHTSMFPCGQCHTKLFPMKKSSGKMKMDDMYAGRLCGACHNGKMGFSSQECEKCHKM